VLRAEGSKTAAILRAEGESKAIQTVFSAIHEGRPDRELLSYQYLQMLPQLAQGEANKIFVIPSEFSQALGGLAERLGATSSGNGPSPDLPSPPKTAAPEDSAAKGALEEARAAAKEAEGEAGAAEQAGPGRPMPPPPPA
jgi:hypothetical protein